MVGNPKTKKHNSYRNCLFDKTGMWANQPIHQMHPNECCPFRSVLIRYTWHWHQERLGKPKRKQAELSCVTHWNCAVRVCDTAPKLFPPMTSIIRWFGVLHRMRFFQNSKDNSNATTGARMPSIKIRVQTECKIAITYLEIMQLAQTILCVRTPPPMCRSVPDCCHVLARGGEWQPGCEMSGNLHSACAHEILLRLRNTCRW